LGASWIGAFVSENMVSFSSSGLLPLGRGLRVNSSIISRVTEGAGKALPSATVLTAEIKSSGDTAVNNTVIIVMGFLKHTVARQP